MTDGFIIWSWNEGELEAINNGGESLGWLKLERVGAHMHWCWYQNTDIRMSPSCLEEVRKKQKELFKDRKKSEG